MDAKLNSPDCREARGEGGVRGYKFILRQERVNTVHKFVRSIDAGTMGAIATHIAVNQIIFTKYALQ
jgi:hypothetical protein